MSIINEARQEAIKVLKRCIATKGVYASGSKNSYQAIWSRDAFISLLGGSLVGKDFKNVFKNSLSIMVKNQSALGQIPNCVGDYNIDRKSDVTFTTIDSSCWFIIGEFVFVKAYKDESLLKKHQKAINKTLTWLKCQDSGEDGLPEQQPTSDWQDAFPHKYGHAISTQAMYYQVLKFLSRKKDADIVKKIVNGKGRADMNMFDNQKGYYLPWIWKNHDGDREQSDWFDSLGNLLAITTGLADANRANKILKFIEKNRVNLPYPVKAIYPPIRPSSKDWRSYFSKCSAKNPYHYLNAGIWPYIGGFYVTSLVKVKKFIRAKKELEILAQANRQGKNREWDFNEWLHGITGKPMGGELQAWSAGMYIFAYHCVKEKKVLFF